MCLQDGTSVPILDMRLRSSILIYSGMGNQCQERLAVKVHLRTRNWEPVPAIRRHMNGHGTVFRGEASSDAAGYGLFLLKTRST